MKRIAVIGTGGTISSLGSNAFDVQDYVRLGLMLDAEAMIARFPDASRCGSLVPVAFPPVPSTDVAFPEWKLLASLIEQAIADGIEGVVVLHGTATMEETAYALHLTVPRTIPVVLTGAQRPATGLSTDGPSNFVAAVRVAASEEALGLGVLVVFNEEVHAARDVTKTSTWRLDTFRSRDTGPLGVVDADTIAIYRKPSREGAGAFDISGISELPRVDIALSYAGSDGAAIDAFRSIGAAGIVSAGFGPGFTTPAELEALKRAVDAGVLVVQASRCGSGRAAWLTRHREAGFLAADNLLPQKARILLSLAITWTSDRAEIAKIIQTY